MHSLFEIKKNIVFGFCTKRSGQFMGGSELELKTDPKKMVPTKFTFMWNIYKWFEDIHLFKML